jgi:hypothetical protein
VALEAGRFRGLVLGPYQIQKICSNGSWKVFVHQFHVFHEIHFEVLVFVVFRKFSKH